jgi:hypothetical protein
MELAQTRVEMEATIKGKEELGGCGNRTDSRISMTGTIPL